MDKKILLIGSNGKLSKKIKQYIHIDKSIDLDNKEDIYPFCKKNKNIIAIIATPPSTHKQYIELLYKEKNIIEILCEKPLPEIPNYNMNNEVGKIKIIDHYLYKKNIHDIKNFFTGNREKITKIKFYLCEKNIEDRLWMFQNSEFGGVVYDLGHHLIAILGLLLGYEHIKNIRNIKIKTIKFFGNNLADKKIKLSFEILNLKIVFHFGKQMKTNKKCIIFFNNKMKIKTFNIDDNVNYINIIKDKSKLLSIEEASQINDFLKKIIISYKTSQELNRYKYKDKNLATNVLAQINEEFKHRHNFYWSIYYKLLFYYLSLISAPAALYYYIHNNTNFIGKNYILYISLILSIIIFFTIKFYFLKKTEIYLNEEEHRLKIAIENMRHIYYANFKINMYPKEKQFLEYQDILFNKHKKDKCIEKGVGGEFMIINFNIILLTASIVSVLLFFYAAIIN